MEVEVIGEARLKETQATCTAQILHRDRPSTLLYMSHAFLAANTQKTPSYHHRPQELVSTRRQHSKEIRKSVTEAVLVVGRDYWRNGITEILSPEPREG